MAITSGSAAAALNGMKNIGLGVNALLLLDSTGAVLDEFKTIGFSPVTYSGGFARMKTSSPVVFAVPSGKQPKWIVWVDGSYSGYKTNKVEIAAVPTYPTAGTYTVNEFEVRIPYIDFV